MIKNIFDINFIKNNEVLFFVVMSAIILMIIVAFVLGYKESKK